MLFLIFGGLLFDLDWNIEVPESVLLPLVIILLCMMFTEYCAYIFYLGSLGFKSSQTNDVIQIVFMSLPDMSVSGCSLCTCVFMV